MDLVTRTDLYAIGRNQVITTAKKIDPAQVDVLGSDVNIVVGSTSVMAYACILQLAFAMATKLLDNAEGDDLDRYAWDRYQLTRKGASASLGAEVFSRTNGSGGAGTIPSGTLINASTGQKYLTTQDASFTSGTGAKSDTTVTANIRAVQAGKLGQAGANAITKFASPASIFDQTITLNNPLPTAGGEDAEDDDTFRERVRGFWVTARRGVLSAISFGALQVPGVVSASAVEVINDFGQPARLVNLYISDSSGVANQQLADAVSAQLSDFRASGIHVVVFTSIPQIVNVVLHLTFAAGTDTVGVGAQVQAAVVNYINSLAVNQALTRAALGSVLQRFTQLGLIVDQTSVVAPIGDIVPAVGQTLRTTLANVSLQ